MKKLIIKAALIIFVLLGFKMVVIEPDKPHTFEVTIPSFTDTVQFFDKVGDAAEEVAKDFEVVPIDCISETIGVFSQRLSAADSLALHKKVERFFRFSLDRQRSTAKAHIQTERWICPNAHLL